MKNIVKALFLLVLLATTVAAQPTSGHQEVTIDERFQRSDAFGILKLEDSASASGDAGACYGVRNDSDTALTSTDGDYGAVSVDSVGRQKVSVGSPLFQSFSTGATYASNDTAEAGSTTTVINATAHVARIGALVTFGASSTLRAGQSWVVGTTANTITLAPPLPVAPNTGDFFYISWPQAPSIDSAGQALSRLKDAVGNNLDKDINVAFVPGSTGLQPLFRMADSTLISAATTATNGRMGVALMDRDGRVFANIDGSGVTQIGTTCSAAATTTADTQIKAGISSTRIYVRAISCKNNSAVPSGIVFKDGSTTVWVGAVGAVGDEFVVASLFPPLRGSVNTAFNFAMDVTSTSTICCADWYLDGD